MKKSSFDNTIWGGKKIKLSILVPARDTVHSHFAFSLSQLMKTNAEIGIDTYLFFDLGTVLLNQRENLINNALEINSDYVLWLDSDMIFPTTTATRLLNHNKDVVGCNYMKRSLPLKTVAYKDLNDWDTWVPLKPSDDLIEVQGVGLGCILMKTSIFKKLKKPFFEFTYDKKTDSWLGEDFNLCKKLKKIGYSIYIDSILSMDIKHIGNYAFGNKNK